MAKTRTFTFSSRPEAVSAARRALDGFDAHLEAGTFYDASLCVSELVTNAVLHAEVGPEQQLELDVTIDAGLLRVTVTDMGASFPAPEPSLGDESGWGLFIVDRLSDRWGVEHEGGTRVWFEIGASQARNGAMPEPASAEAREEPGEALAPNVQRRSTGRLKLRPQTTA